MPSVERTTMGSSSEPYLLMGKNGAPVDMVTIPIIYKVSYMSGACLGFLNHQQYSMAVEEKARTELWGNSQDSKNHQKIFFF